MIIMLLQHLTNWFEYNVEIGNYARAEKRECRDYGCQKYLDREDLNKSPL